MFARFSSFKRLTILSKSPKTFFRFNYFRLSFSRSYSVFLHRIKSMCTRTYTYLIHTRMNLTPSQPIVVRIRCFLSVRSFHCYCCCCDGLWMCAYNKCQHMIASFKRKSNQKRNKKNVPISPSSSSMCGNYREPHGIRSNIHSGYVYMHAYTRLPHYDRSAAADDLLSVVCVHRKGKEGTIIIIIAMIIEQWFENTMNVLIGVHSKSQLLRYQSSHRNNGQDRCNHNNQIELLKMNRRTGFHPWSSTLLSLHSGRIYLVNHICYFSFALSFAHIQW